MVDSFAIAGHLAADNPGGVGVVRRAANPANVMRIDLLDLQCAGRRTIVGTDAGMYQQLKSLIFLEGWSGSRRMLIP